MKLEPSYDLHPPKMSPASAKFHRMLLESDNWRLIGLETLTVWLKSTIAACLVAEELAER